MLADRLGYIYIDTGAMYRAVTYLAQQNNILSGDAAGLAKLAATASIELISVGGGKQQVICNGEDVTEKIRDPRVSREVSLVSSHREVRQELVRLQQDLASNRNVVMDGRDIGTVVLPHARCKIFLTASLEERAKRRFAELLAKGYTGTFEQARRELALRDQIDAGRAVDPLQPAADAAIIDTTGLNQEEVVKRILDICPKKEEL